MDIDDVYVRTGEFGKFQWRAFIGCCLANLYCGFEMVQSIFSGSIPAVMNCTNTLYEACDEDCTEITYPEDNFSSFATEWNMVCDPSVSATHSTQSIFMSGVMVGSFFMGGLGDRFGRFPVVVGSQGLCALFSLASSFANTWTLYIILRFFTGFCLSGIIIVSFVLTSELVGPSKRGIVGTMPALAFAVGICILSLTAWLTQNWRTMSAVLAGFGILLTPILYGLYEESPRWHLGKGNGAKCQAILKKIAKQNGHELGDINLKVSSGSDDASSGVSMISLFKNKILRKISLIQMVSWFTVSSVYYGVTIASGGMGDSKYVSVIFSALVEIPANLIILYIMNIPKCGRVKSCVVGLFASSIFCASIWFIPESYTKTSVALACTGKFFIVGAFSIVYVQAAELYPTPVRNVGLGLVSVFNRVGGILAPQIVTLNTVYKNSHFLVFGIIGCFAGALCLLLPETLGRPLPENPEDIYAKDKIEKSTVPIRIGDKQSLLSDMIDDEEEEDTRF